MADICTITILGERLKNKTFCFTGIFNYDFAAKAEYCIKALGGSVTTEVGPSLNYIVVGVLLRYEKTPELLKALELNQTQSGAIEQIDETKMAEMLIPDKDDCTTLELSRV